MDLSVQKCVKHRMRNLFEDYYSEKVAPSLERNQELKIDLSLTTLKPLSAKCLLSAVDYLKDNQEIVFNGFKESGIAEHLGYYTLKELLN